MGGAENKACSMASGRNEKERKTGGGRKGQNRVGIRGQQKVKDKCAPVFDKRREERGVRVKGAVRKGDIRSWGRRIAVSTIADFPVSGRGMREGGGIRKKKRG